MTQTIDRAFNVGIPEHLYSVPRNVLEEAEFKNKTPQYEDQLVDRDTYIRLSRAVRWTGRFRHA